MLPALAVGGGDEHLERCVTGSRTHPGKARVDPHRAGLRGDNRIGHAQGQIVVRMDAALGFRFEHPVIGLETCNHAIHVERPAAVGDIDAMRAIAFHQQRLLGERLGLDHVAHHQESRYVHAQIARDADVLLADVGLGAVGRDPDRAHSHRIGPLEFFGGADTGHQKRCQHRVLDYVGGSLDPVPVGMGAKSVIEGRTVQAIAVRDLDRIHPCLVKRLSDRADAVGAIHMQDGVHPVAQGHVLDVEPIRCWIKGHAAIFSI